MQAFAPSGYITFTPPTSHSNLAMSYVCVCLACLQLDKATADAAEFKAGFDKLLVDTAEQQAVIDKATVDAVEMKAGFDKLLVDTSEQKAQASDLAA